MTGNATDDLPPCQIYIDEEGRWFHKGMEMIHREYVRLFYRNMDLDDRGRYVIEWQGSRCYVDVADTAFVVRSVTRQDDAGWAKFLLSLSDDTEEELLPDTLRVGERNVLYCRVKGRRFPARFKRPAYYELARHVAEEGGRFYLPLNGVKHPIRGA